MYKNIFDKMNYIWKNNKNSKKSFFFKSIKISKILNNVIGGQQISRNVVYCKILIKRRKKRLIVIKGFWKIFRYLRNNKKIC